MGNHYHTLLRIPDARLSQALQRLHTEYSRHHNRRHRRSAHLFRAHAMTREITSDAQRERCRAQIQSTGDGASPPTTEPRRLRRSLAAYRRSLFDSMSNHIANSVNCDPKISSSATSTTVPTETMLPSTRSTTSAMPRPRPSTVIRKPNM